MKASCFHFQKKILFIYIHKIILLFFKQILLRKFEGLCSLKTLLTQSFDIRRYHSQEWYI